MKIHTTALTLRIPKELKTQLTKLAKQARQHRSTLVREILEQAAKKSTLTAALILGSILGLSSFAAAKDHFVPVEVVSVQTQHWTTTGHKNGSPGTTTTECSGNYNITCSSTTQGYRSASDYTIEHTQVNVMLKMPDGSMVQGQCQIPHSLLSVCLEPHTGVYQAQIHGHDVHLFIPTEGRPKYGKDGNIKKPGKTAWTEVRFSW